MSPSATYSLSVLTVERSDPRLGELAAQELLERSNDGAVEVRWSKVDGEVTIATNLFFAEGERAPPAVGIVSIRDSSIVDASAARRAAEAVWADMSVSGAELP